MSLIIVHSLVRVASRVSIIFHVNEHCQDKFCIGGKKMFKLSNFNLVAKSGQVGSSCKFNKKDSH